jgi:putative transcriptional regulator
LYIFTLDFSALFCYNKDNGKGGEFSMAIRYKIDILAELKKKGYSSTKIREEKLIGQSYLQQLRHGELVSWKTLDTICSLLDCQPADLIEYVKDEE